MKDKNTNAATTQSFFYQFRKNEEILANDILFQRKLRKQSLAFRDRRIQQKKRVEDEDSIDAEEGRSSILSEHREGAENVKIHERLLQQSAQSEDEAAARPNTQGSDSVS